MLHSHPLSNLPKNILQASSTNLSSLSGASKSHQKKRSSSKLFSVLSHTIHGIMDVDPETTRRNSIGKTRDSIIQVSLIVKFFIAFSLFYMLSSAAFPG